MSSIIAHWNGRKEPLSTLQIPVEDRAYYFGDAIYEVIRVYKGHMWKMKEHMARMERSLRELRMLEQFSVSRIYELVLENAQVNSAHDALIYIQLSRGTAPRQHDFPKQISGNSLIYTKNNYKDPFDVFRESGIKIILQPEIRWLRRDIKTVNLLANCLAKQVATENGAQEAVFYEENGTITECSSNNIFIVKDGKVLTHPADNHVLHGISRGHVIDMCRRLKIECQEVRFTKQDLLDAAEVFVTGTSTEVLWVREIDGLRKTIDGEGAYLRLRKQFSVDIDKMALLGGTA